MKPCQLLVSIAVAFASMGAVAQSGLIMGNGQVNETALMEALLPPPAFPTRQIRIGPAQPAAASKTPQAHMLITFETNSAELEPSSRKLLDALAHVIQSERMSTYKFAIEGHADKRGTEQANMELSQRRAEAVAAYLSQNYGIDPSRLKPIGKGQSEPLNLTQADAPENRRVTVKTLTE